MPNNKKAEEFFAAYSNEVMSLALQLRKVLLKQLPFIIEQIDMPAKMMAYCYGQKYVDLICVIIPSKKGLKLGFNRGVELPDPEKLLEGTGKISRYINIKSDAIIHSAALKKMLADAFELYHLKVKKTAE